MHRISIVRTCVYIYIYNYFIYIYIYICLTIQAPFQLWLNHLAAMFDGLGLPVYIMFCLQAHPRSFHTNCTKIGLSPINRKGGQKNDEIAFIGVQTSCFLRFPTCFFVFQLASHWFPDVS